MRLNILFDEIIRTATCDKGFKKRLLAAYQSDRPIINFCRECNAAGIEIYPMDIIDADESTYAAMRRSTNGGGENSPHLTWEEDIFGSLIGELERL